MNSLLIVVSILVACGGLFSWQLSQQIRAGKEKLIAAQISVSDINSVAQWEEKLQEINYIAEREARIAEKAAAAEKPRTRSARETLNNLLAVEMEIETDRRYTALFKKLRLPFTEANKLKEILALRSIGASLDTSPLDQFSSREHVDKFQAVTYSRIQALLGEKNYALFMEFENYLPSSNFIAHLQNLLLSRNALIDAEQLGSLSNVIYNAQFKSVAGVQDTTLADRRAIAMGSSEQIISESTITEAALFLTSAQLTELRRLYEIQQAGRAVEHVADAAYKLPPSQ